MCSSHVDKPVSLSVYSSKDQSVRGMVLLRPLLMTLMPWPPDIVLVPSTTWGGEGVLGKPAGGVLSLCMLSA